MARVAVPAGPDTDVTTLQTQIAEVDRKGGATSVSLAGQEQHLTVLDGRAAALETVGQHGWHGVNGSVNSGADLQAGGWTVDRNAGIAVNTAGSLVLNRAGRWSLTWYADSDCSVAGIMTIYLAWPSGAWTPSLTNLTDTRYRGTGFGGAGALRQSVRWSGWVDATAAGAPIQVRIAWGGASNVAATVSAYALLADYLGGVST